MILICKVTVLLHASEDPAAAVNNVFSPVAYRLVFCFSPEKGQEG